jgi:hypothetical protein
MHAIGCPGNGYYSWLEGAGTERSKLANPALFFQGERGCVSPDPLNPNRFRLERMGIAMAGLGKVQVSGSILQGASRLSYNMTSSHMVMCQDLTGVCYLLEAKSLISEQGLELLVQSLPEHMEWMAPIHCILSYKIVKRSLMLQPKLGRPGTGPSLNQD